MFVRKEAKAKKGFTLVELLVTVAIIAVLSAVLMPRLLGYTERARQARAMSDISSMKTVVEVFAADEGNGLYPAKDQVGSVLQARGIAWTSDANGVRDPWGNPYYYTALIDQNTNQSQYIFVSPGLDQRIGTADDVFTTDKVQPTVGAADTETFPGLTADPIDASASYVSGTTP